MIWRGKLVFGQDPLVAMRARAWDAGNDVVPRARSVHKTRVIRRAIHGYTCLHDRAIILKP